MPKKPSERIAMKIRMKEGLRRSFEAEAKRDGVSVNAAIERRLGQALTEDATKEFIRSTAKLTAMEMADTTDARIDDLMKTVTAEFARLEARIDSRILNLHEAIQTMKKEK